MAQFEEITIKVRKETADSIRKIKETTKMNEGEIIERALMNIKAKSSEIAPIVALQELTIIFSELDKNEAGKAFIETIMLLLNSIPLNDEVNSAMYKKTIEAQIKTYGEALAESKDTKFVLDCINSFSIGGNENGKNTKR